MENLEVNKSHAEKLIELAERSSALIVCRCSCMASHVAPLDEKHLQRVDELRAQRKTDTYIAWALVDLLENHHRHELRRFTSYHKDKLKHRVACAIFAKRKPN